MHLFYSFHRHFHWPSVGVIQAKIELNLKGKYLKSEESSFFISEQPFFKALQYLAFPYLWIKRSGVDLHFL